AADDLERLVAEARDDPLGELGSEAGDGARAEVALDALERRRRERLVAGEAELFSPLPVVFPGAVKAHLLADLDAGEVSHDGDGPLAGAQARDDERARRVAEDEPLERALEGLLLHHAAWMRTRRSAAACIRRGSPT